MKSDASPSVTPRRDLVENEIFERATTLFAERGFAGTSLQDIADAMGMTRPALYYYFRNKDEILAKLVAEITESSAKMLSAINADKSRAPLDRLRAMVRTTALQIAEQPSRFLLLIRSESDLPSSVAHVHERARKKVLLEYLGVLDECVRLGLIRPVDTRVAALAIIGMGNWVAWWHHPKDGRTAVEIAEQIAEMAVLSVAQSEARHEPGLHGAIKLLRQDLEYLERAAKDGNSGKDGTSSASTAASQRKKSKKKKA